MNKWIYFENEAVNLDNAHSILFVKEEYERVYSVIIKTPTKDVIWEFEQNDRSDDEFTKSFEGTRNAILKALSDKDVNVLVVKK